MTPSATQVAGSDSEHDSVYEKALDPDTELSPWPLVSGIRNHATAMRAFKAAQSVGAEPAVKKRIAQYLNEYDNE
jgi:hypothetical protein